MRSGTLSKQIAEDVLKKQRPMDINRAAFLALRDDIIEAIDDGWPVKRIWETLRNQGKISFSYPAFMGYVNRLILRDRQKQNPPTPDNPSLVNPQKTVSKTASDTPQAVNVKRLDIMQGDEINPRKFDLLIEWLAESEQDAVIDNGAATFVPLSHYLVANQVPDLLQELGYELLIHTVITGGQALKDTMTGFSNLASQFPQRASFVVWLNPYWGAIEMNGLRFEQSKAYLENKGRVSAIVTIPPLKEETFGRDLSDMLQSRLTFDESIAMPSLSIMARQRLKLIRTQLFGQMENAAVL